ncbi:Ketosteroid isomerase homolog [Bryocella elongata]|uniref:Ketosteroid isomerase homolog n=1 Tax=Bryocella elongata TaxID=863522 RepID=A0A1H6B1U4_9BACT|nr:nuclear transport factor 2 family protein [Bryocella elongata]SEG54590.1 Ketosteroid isomerase homolog [Bryocella elongata]
MRGALWSLCRAAAVLALASAGFVSAQVPTLTPFGPGQAQPSLPDKKSPSLTPVPMPVLSPGVVELLRLEGEFGQAVAKGGGKAFADWFADDGVTLSNGKPPVQGKTAIAAIAQWDPKVYQLTWYPEGAQVGPSGDTGFTWGHYDATTNSPDGKSTTTSGRYITFWKKVGGKWKVAMDASADDTHNLP